VGGGGVSGGKNFVGAVGGHPTMVDVEGTIENPGSTMDNVCLIYVSLQGGGKVRLERGMRGEEDDPGKWNFNSSLRGKKWLVTNVEMMAWDELEGVPIVRWGQHSCCGSVEE